MDGAGDEEQKHAAGCEYVKQLLLTVSSMASGLNSGLMRYVTRPIVFAVKAPWKMLTVVPGFSAMKQPVEAFFMSSTDASTHAPRPKRRGVLGGSELKPGACACLACCRRALQCRRARPGSPKMPPPELRRTSPRFHPQQSDAEARRHGHQGLPAATLLPGAPCTGAECGQHGGPLGSLPLGRQQLERVPPGGEAAELDGGDGVCSERDGIW